MLNCKITKAFTAFDCDTHVSGIQKIAIATFDETHAVTSSGTDNCLIDTIDLGDDTIKFYDMPFLSTTASATAEIATNGSQDSKYFTHAVTFTAPQIDCNVLDQWKNYALGTVVIAVLTKDGQVQLYGWDNGLTASAMSYTTGANAGDTTGVACTFDGPQKNAPLLVKDWSVITGLMATA